MMIKVAGPTPTRGCDRGKDTVLRFFPPQTLQKPAGRLRSSDRSTDAENVGKFPRVFNHGKKPFLCVLLKENFDKVLPEG